jgi:virginiamycin B lyase
MVWVSEGADGTVYGVDSSDSTWRYTGSGWTPGSGPLTQLSVGTSTHIWGVDSHDNIWSTTVSTVL